MVARLSLLDPDRGCTLVHSYAAQLSLPQFVALSPRFTYKIYE